MLIRNQDVIELIAEIPEGHRHLRTTIILNNGTKMTFQEATIANLVRSYISIKTHPLRTAVVLKNSRVEKRKDGYAEYQLMECQEA